MKNALIGSVLVFLAMIPVACKKNSTPAAPAPVTVIQLVTATATITPTQGTPQITFTPTYTSTPLEVSVTVENYGSEGVVMTMDNGTPVTVLPGGTSPITFITPIGGNHLFKTTAFSNYSFNGLPFGASYACSSSSLTPGSNYYIPINCGTYCMVEDTYYGRWDCYFNWTCP